jgi:hypothetical protein
VLGSVLYKNTQRTSEEGPEHFDIMFGGQSGHYPAA